MNVDVNKRSDLALPVREKEPGLGLRFSWPLRGPGEVLEARFVELIDREDRRHALWNQYALAQGAQESIRRIGGSTLGSRRTEYGQWCLVRLEDDVIGLFAFSRGSATVELAGKDPNSLDRVHDSLVERIGAEPEAAGTVPVTFWAMGAHGPKSARRPIAALAWSQIAANYEQSTGQGMAELITAKVPETGRLILWHGEPGTGKTSALRALAEVWGDWCATHFVTDPEAFLGSGTSYLLDVLTMEASSRRNRVPEWKLVVLEDSGELLTADAHERSGQALSRLLNTTDGLLGQGMKVIVLITTNEPLRKLHPAIQRPGRCWKQIEFLTLTAREANSWLASHDSATRVIEPTTIADLYAVLRGREPSIRRTFGFNARP